MTSLVAAAFGEDRVPFYEIRPVALRVWRAPEFISRDEQWSLPPWALPAAGSLIFAAAGMACGAWFHI